MKLAGALLMLLGIGAIMLALYFYIEALATYARFQGVGGDPNGLSRDISLALRYLYPGIPLFLVGAVLFIAAYARRRRTQLDARRPLA